MAIIAFVLAALYYRKRRYRHKQLRAEIDPVPEELSFRPTILAMNIPRPLDASHDWSSSSLLPKDADLRPDNIPPPTQLLNYETSITTHIPASSVVTTSTSQCALSSEPSQPAEVETITHTSIIPSAVLSTSTIPPTRTHPTEQYSELVQRPTNLLHTDVDLKTNDILPSSIPPQSTVAHVPTAPVATGIGQSTLLSKLPQSTEVETIARASINPSMVMSASVNPPTGAHVTEEHSELVQSFPISPLREDVDLETDDISPSFIPPKSEIQSANAQVPTSSMAAETTQHILSSQSPPLTEADTIARSFITTPGVVMQTATSSPRGPRLSEEQSELVQSLIRHNVPLPTVVDAIEGLLRTGGPSGGGQLEGLEPDNPPEYDFT